MPVFCYFFRNINFSVTYLHRFWTTTFFLVEEKENEIEGRKGKEGE